MQVPANRKGAKQMKAAPKTGKGSGSNEKKSVTVEEKTVQVGAFQIKIELSVKRVR